MIIENIVRIIIALIFTLISLGLLRFTFFITKKEPNHTHNLKASAILCGALYLFSFFPNVILSAIAAIIGLLAIKYFYIHHWKETLHIWAIWMVLWIILILFVVGITITILPTESAI